MALSRSDLPHPLGLCASHCDCAVGRPASQASPARTFTSAKTRTTYTYVIVPHTEAKSPKFETVTPGLIAPGPEDFTGNDRKAAKTSLVNGSPANFVDVARLLRSPLFVADATMVKRNPPISKAASSDRIAEERHNVVVTGFLYASTRESDNDFHCIVGMATAQAPQYVNVEVSGLPVSGAFRPPIKAARDSFAKFFGEDLPTSADYSKFNPPIKVRITGSIFFDVDHKAGTIGPLGMRPKTAWEIHPVSEIVFEP